MVADLDGEDLSGTNSLQLPRKMISTLFNFRERYFPLRVKDGGAIAVPCPSSFPRPENRVVYGRPHLRICPFTARLRARFLT